MLNINVDAIPQELKDRPQWLVWLAEDRDGKTTKVPYNVHTGGLASSTNPATWATFDAALARYSTGAGDGIGFVFSADDPYCGVDIDHCADSEGNASQEAVNIIRHLDSYTELSPSGQGAHIILRGSLPPDGRRKGSIEMYDQGRYFTVTGNHWQGTPATVRDRQDQLTQLHTKLFLSQPVRVNEGRIAQPVNIPDDKILIDRASHAKNGADFDRLWRGDASAYRRADGTADLSAADMALANHLAFWTGGDASRMDRLFRQSGLMRDKWDERHYANGHTYGQETVTKAANNSTSFFGQAAPVLTIINPQEPTEAAISANDDLVIPDYPALPDAALTVYEHTAPCAQWLDDYIAFATAAAPKAPRSFHEAAGLFAGGVTIARRLRLPVANTYIYPNLYIFFTADSTIYSKSTAFRVLEETFKAADMRHFLLPTPKTSEALLQELSTNIPNGYHNADEETRQHWLKERAFSASRGWTMDEAQGLFDGFKRDFSAGLMAVMLRLYESPDVTTEQTVSRWRVTVKNASLSFFGASTPAAMGEHFGNRTLWNNGMFPRFALVVPDEPPRRVFWHNHIPTPLNVIRGLQRLADLFPAARAVIENKEDADGKRLEVELYDVAEPSEALLADGVWQAWEAYSLTTGHDLLRDGAVEPDLFSAYGRLGTHAIKVALILAAMDTEALPVRIELRHFARAQAIVEGWRVAMHQLRATVATAPKESLADRMIAMLLDAGVKGLSTRDVYRPLHIDDGQAIHILEGMERQGRAVRATVRARNGRMVETWLHADFAPAPAQSANVSNYTSEAS